MSEDANADELTDALRTAFAERIRSAVSGLPASQALQLADTLCHVQIDLLAGKRVRFKAAKAIDADAITEDWRRGLLIKEIVDKHGCSRVTAYRYHPKKRKSAA